MLRVTESPEIRRANRRFMRRSVRAPLLSRDHEMALARRWRDERDAGALHELVLAYARIVIRAASRYRGYGLAMADLMQEGIVGLLLAAERCDPGRGARFSTYARWWVRAAMQDFVLRNWSVVRTGTTAAHKALFFNLNRLRARIGDAGGPMTPESRRRIAADLKVRISDVEFMESRLAAADRSLNAPIGEGGEDEWQDLLVDGAASPEDIVIERRDAERRARWLAVALAELPERDRRIIRERRLGDEAVTLEALGRTLGISKERVRQIERRAFDRIRQSIVRQSAAPAAPSPLHA